MQYAFRPSTHKEPSAADSRGCTSVLPPCIRSMTEVIDLSRTDIHCTMPAGSKALSNVMLCHYGTQATRLASCAVRATMFISADCSKWTVTSAAHAVAVLRNHAPCCRLVTTITKIRQGPGADHCPPTSWMCPALLQSSTRTAAASSLADSS